MAGAGGAVAGSMKASAVAGQFLELAFIGGGDDAEARSKNVVTPQVPGHQSSLEKLRVAWVVIGYALSSSLLAIVNKYAVTVFPLPSNSHRASVPSVHHCYARAGKIEAYAWAWAYLIVITFEMVYIKSVVMSIGLNTWGLVLYNNMLALSNCCLWSARIFSIGTLFPVALSCIFGLTISFFGFAARKAVSATAYTVVGVTNKLLTVLINMLIWDKHAQAPGLVALLVCIFGGVLYQQSVTQTQPTKTIPADIESVPLKSIKSEFGDGKPVVRVQSAEAASEE
ncbi:unnamed protein product [Closterium sp. NIES-64]|nr:unnamed protein product [Closterium sp. NIES-64]